MAKRWQQFHCHSNGTHSQAPERKRELGYHIGVCRAMASLLQRQGHIPVVLQGRAKRNGLSKVKGKVSAQLAWQQEHTPVIAGKDCGIQETGIERGVVESKVMHCAQ